MSLFARRIAIGLSLGAALALGPVASIAATRAVTVPVRLAAPIRSSHTQSRLLPLSVAPLFAGFATRHGISPIHALPPLGRLAPAPVRFVPLLGRIVWADVLGPISPVACDRSPRTVKLAVLPATPFVPPACAVRSIGDDGALPPPSLVSGHDRNALYGRAYSPNAQLH